MSNWHFLLSGISVFSPLIPLFFFFLSWKNKFDDISRLLFVYCVVAFAVDLFCWTSSSWLSSNLPVFNLFTYFEFVVIVSIFRKILSWQEKKIFIILLTLYSIYYAFIFIRHLEANEFYNRTLESVVIILLSIITFFNLIEKSHTERLQEDYVFWLNTAFLIYFSGTLFLFIFEYTIMRNQHLSFLWIIHNFFNILFNLLLARSAYQWMRKTR
jgi:hypothetical protein